MPGIKPMGKIQRRWSSKFAYAIGLLATDGCLSKDGRHIDLTSKDIEQLNNFLLCTGLKNKIGQKVSGYGGKKVSRIQFGDIEFYRFLLEIGLTPAKSRTLGALQIPNDFFFDFLRGSFDCDGSFYSYFDPRWKASFMFYTAFVSASLTHIQWLRDKIESLVGVRGHVSRDGNKVTYQLKYAKRDSQAILKKMYYNYDVICLKRKRLKIEKALNIIGEQL